MLFQAVRTGVPSTNLQSQESNDPNSSWTTKEHPGIAPRRFDLQPVPDDPGVISQRLKFRFGHRRNLCGSNCLNAFL